VLDAIATANGKVSPASLARAAEYLRGTQQADGSWSNSDGTTCVIATSLAIRGLVASGIPSDDESIAAGLNWLAVNQLPNGSWIQATSARDAVSSPDNDVRGCPVHTAAALFAFVATDKSNHTTALRAVNFLVEIQEVRGGWSGGDFVLPDTATGRTYRNDLYTTAGPLLALSRWAVAAPSAQPAAAAEQSFRLVGTATDT
jgi:squalene cyclase